MPCGVIGDCTLGRLPASDKRSSKLVATIFAVAYGGGHIACLVPVVERLRARGDRVVLLALTTAAQTCRDRRLEHVRLADFLSVLDPTVPEMGRLLSAGQSIHPAVGPEETFAYLGAGYGDLVDAHGQETAGERFRTLGRQAFLPVASMRRILQEVAPDVVLTTSAPRSERATVIAAAQLGLPAVVIVDLFALSEEAWLSDPEFGSRICVLEEGVRSRLLVAGRKPESVTVTGNPVFDRLADPELQPRGRLLRQERGWNAASVITWASQPEPSDPTLPRRIEAVLTQSLEAHPQWQLVVRRHPSEQAPPLPTHPRLQLSTRSDDLHVLLAASDAVVTMTSTVGLEALLLGRPLVTFDGSENTRFCPYNAMGMSLGVPTMERLPLAVAQALAGRAPRPVLPQVGCASERILGVIDSLI